ncbi:MAG TPA: alanine acetyltransferase [Stenotrophomonas sp.]|nr:alanine acetyltransferase [Stenotrophomonas sp.]
MSDAAGMPWSSEQLSWLQALGHVVYVDRTLEVEAVVPQAAALAEAPRAAVDSAPVRRQAPAAPDTRMPAGSDHVQAAEATSAPPRRGRPGMPDRLQIALLRASGLNPNDPATQTLMGTWPLAELRANPRAKRALWPQLRALRKQGKSRP